MLTYSYTRCDIIRVGARLRGFFALLLAQSEFAFVDHDQCTILIFVFPDEELKLMKD
jgi:hypothetical protein